MNSENYGQNTAIFHRYDSAKVCLFSMSLGWIDAIIRALLEITSNFFSSKIIEWVCSSGLLRIDCGPFIITPS